MTDTTITSGASGNAGVLLALGLLGAGAGVGLGVLLQDTGRREACAQMASKLGLPQLCRGVAAALLLRAASAVRGQEELGSNSDD